MKRIVIGEEQGRCSLVTGTRSGSGPTFLAVVARLYQRVLPSFSFWFWNCRSHFRPTP